MRARLFQSSAPRILVLLGIGSAFGWIGNWAHPHGLSISDPIYSKAEESPVCVGPHKAGLFQYQPIGVQQVLRLRKERKLAVADLRSAFAYGSGHIPRAVHLPCRGEKGKSVLNSLGTGVALVLYDEDGRSAELELAVEAALSQGFSEIYVLNGGYQSWVKEQPVDIGSCEHCNGI